MTMDYIMGLKNKSLVQQILIKRTKTDSKVLWCIGKVAQLGVRGYRTSFFPAEYPCKNPSCVASLFCP